MAKPIKLWMVEVDGELRDLYALRTRRQVKLQAAMGMMGAGTFDRICTKHGKDCRQIGTFWSVHPGNYALIRDLWAEVKRGHPSARVVRVEVKKP
jgi:hypothetical protein